MPEKLEPENPENPENPGPCLITRLLPHLPYRHACEIGLVCVLQRLQSKFFYIYLSFFKETSETWWFPPFRCVTK